jgi:hypothetical protein
LLAASEFFTVELWTAKGLIRYHVLFVIHLATRELQIPGWRPNRTNLRYSKSPVT